MAAGGWQEGSLESVVGDGLQNEQAERLGVVVGVFVYRI